MFAKTLANISILFTLQNYNSNGSNGMCLLTFDMYLEVLALRFKTLVHTEQKVKKILDIALSI